MTTSTTPPHLARPEIRHLAPDELPGFLATVSHGFYGTPHDETPELDRQLFLPDRTFGHQVDGRWVSTASAFARQLTLPGGAAVDVAAVTVVTVTPTYRRRGLLREMMTHLLHGAHDRGEPAALLWASESGIYGRFGYGMAAPKATQTGPTNAMAFLPDVDLGDGSVAEVGQDEYVSGARVVHQTLLPERPGALDRLDPWWEAGMLDPERDREGYTARRYLLHFDGDGRPSGYATFRVRPGGSSAGPDTVVSVEEVDALEPTGSARLWRFLFDLDLVRRVRRDTAPVDDPMRHLLADPRALVTEVADGTYLRLVDVGRALEARAYEAEVDLVLQVCDPLLAHNDARFHLAAGPEGASVTRVQREPDLTVGVRELATVFLGGTSLAVLAAAGRVVEHRDGAVEAGARAFAWPRAPFTPDQF